MAIAIAIATATSSPSPTPSPTTIPTGILINEYLAAPASGESEYVELFNSNPFDVDLSGCQIDDIAGGSSPYR
ncbi:MAG: lamin tail domain-containing protein [Halieaceae bacterium]|nr:lamin tail domain-containing protein [Halieaceae bacterium]